MHESRRADRAGGALRRIKEMKDLGITVTQLDGLHERNVYLDRFGMLLRNTKMICDIAHRHGLKVIEHSDVTIMPYRNQTGYGLKLLLENFDWFQRDVQFDHMINNPCPNNPAFKKHYFDMITEYIAKAGIDCVKLDEIIFARGRACGCPHCRAKFKMDTGLELPDDHTDPFFDSSSGGRTFTNVNDRRLLTWFRWRMECLAQWRLDLREAINKVNRHAEPVADVAVLFSDQSRNWERMAGYLADTGGYSECMSDTHIQHVFLMEGDLKADKLAKYRLLMLISTSCISDAQADEVRPYVKAGGRLLISGHASLLDELGFARKDFALSDVMNVRYRGGWAPKGCALKMADRTIPLAHRAMHVKLADPAKSKIIGELIDDKGRVWGPAIVETKHGQGSVIYDACRLGIYNWETEYTVGDKYPYRCDKAKQDLAVDLVRRAHGQPMIFEVGPTTPEKVFITAYRQRRDGKTQILVHLLNATGSVIKTGQIIPETTPAIPWPVLHEDLCFEIELPSLKRAHIVSPDFAGPRPVRVTTRGNRHTVAVSKSDLQWFSTACFDIR